MQSNTRSGVFDELGKKTSRKQDSEGTKTNEASKSSSSLRSRVKAVVVGFMNPDIMLEKVLNFLGRYVCTEFCDHIKEIRIHHPFLPVQAQSGFLPEKAYKQGSFLNDC